MKTALIVLITLLVVYQADAQDYGTAQVHTLIAVIDGDTFRADIVGWPSIVAENIRVRVRGVDSPEIRNSKCKQEKILARKARSFTARLLWTAQKIELRAIERGKYFRLLADVVFDGQNLATALIESGHGRPYRGKGSRPDWCGESD